MCPHTPQCPDANAVDREAARVIASHPEQGWSLLCNGVVVFEDTPANCCPAARSSSRTGRLPAGSNLRPPYRPAGR